MMVKKYLIQCLVHSRYSSVKEAVGDHRRGDGAQQQSVHVDDVDETGLCSHPICTFLWL